MNIQSSVQKPHGDAIDDVTRIKNTFSCIFCDGIFKSDVKFAVALSILKFSKLTKFWD